MNEKQTLRQLTKSIYDIQKLRIQIGNRIAGNFRAKMGQDPGEKLEDKEANKIIKNLAGEFKRLTDGVVLSRKEIPNLIKRSNGVISNEVEFRLIQQYIELIDYEESAFKRLGEIVKTFPIYTQFLDAVKGVGPAMAAVIISELDPHKARHVSSFWRYAGLDVADDGNGRSRKKDHLVRVTYQNKDGEEAEKMGISFNPFLKTKLTGVLGSSFLRAKGGYSDVYYGYRNRLENHPVHKDKTKLHKHNMANRYMVKIFLQDLWLKWRAVEGLPITPPYNEAKLGLKHAANG